MDPLYDAGFVQEMTSNLNLSFRIPFLGRAGAEATVLARTAAGNTSLFYHWQPDLFHARHGSLFRRVAFPHSTRACAKKLGDLSSGRLGGNTCDFPSQQLEKHAAPDVGATAGRGASSFLARFQIDGAQLNELLRHYGADRDARGSDGGNHNRAACVWLRANEHVWKPWVEEAAGLGGIGGSSNSGIGGTSFYSAVVLGAIVAAALLWRGGRWVWRRHLRARPQIMISYRHTDGAFARRLELALQAAGFRVWIDTAITPGNDWRQDIAVAIQSSLAVVFIISPGSVTSKYCKEELFYASALRKPVFPVVHKEAFAELEGGVKTILQRIQWIIFKDNFDVGFATLRQHLHLADRNSRHATREQKSARQRRQTGSTWMRSTRRHGEEEDASSSSSSRLRSSSRSSPRTQEPRQLLRAGAAAPQQLDSSRTDCYICYHPEDAALAQRVRAVLVARNLRAVLAKQQQAVAPGGGGPEPKGSAAARGAEQQHRASTDDVKVVGSCFIEDNALENERADVFCLVLSLASVTSDQCGEELHFAHEHDKPMLVVTGAPVDEVPALLGERGSMGMMIGSSSAQDAVSFHGRAAEAAERSTVAAVFTILAGAANVQRSAQRPAVTRPQSAARRTSSVLWRKVAKAVDGRGSPRASTRTMSDRFRSSMSTRASLRSETTPEPVSHGRQVPAEASLPPVDSAQLEGALVAAASDETTSSTSTTTARATAAGGALAAAKDATV